VNPGNSRQTTSKLVSGLHSRGVLPHLKREGASYFVTFRLAGTLPADVLAKFKAEREAILAEARVAKRPLTWHEQEESFRWYSMRVDKYLDAGHGNCWLALPEIADLTAGALRFHASQRFVLYAWVIMPNHVHAVLRPLPDWTLSLILKSWKGFSGREANRCLKRTGLIFWQVESYDHLIRDDESSKRPHVRATGGLALEQRVSASGVAPIPACGFWRLSSRQFHRGNTGLESPVNPQTRMSALRRVAPASSKPTCKFGVSRDVAAGFTRHLR
jgi:type I restriction enzyme R subunit/putative DNA methylase